MDGDGDYDMLIASGLPTFQLALCENKGGQLSRTITTRIGPRRYSESSIFGDIDNDGNQDIIATYSKEGAIVLFKNNGGGMFDEGDEIFKGTKVSHVQRVYCIDINNDGKMELFSAKGPWGHPGRSIAHGIVRVRADEALGLLKDVTICRALAGWMPEMAHFIGFCDFLRVGWNAAEY